MKHYAEKARDETPNFAASSVIAINDGAPAQKGDAFGSYLQNAEEMTCFEALEEDEELENEVEELLVSIPLPRDTFEAIGFAALGEGMSRQALIIRLLETGLARLPRSLYHSCQRECSENPEV